METTITQSPDVQTAAQLFIASLGIWSIVILIISIVVLLLTIIARWRMFSKAGVGGWRAIIPILSSYTTYKICWAGIAYWIYLVLGIFVYLFEWLAYPVDQLLQLTDTEAIIAFLQTPANQVFFIISLVFVCIRFIWVIVKTWKTSKVFGHGFGYFLGLLFFPLIFECIIGFGRSEYVGVDY